MPKKATKKKQAQDRPAQRKGKSKSKKATRTPKKTTRKTRRTVPKVSAPRAQADEQSPEERELAGHLASLEVKDFKSLKSVSVDFGQVNVFVGANGAGKSCLLEAIGILGACAAGVVDDQALLRRGVRPGVPELYKSSFANERLAPKISLRATSTGGAAYHAYITNSTTNPSPFWKFGNESLIVDGATIASRAPSGNASALGLSVPLENTRSVTTLARASPEAPLVARDLLSTLDDFAIFAPVTPVLRAVAPDSAPRAPVGLYGGQLAEAVGALSTSKSGRAALSRALGLIDWARSIGTGEPSSKFLSPSVPTSRQVVEFRDRFMASKRNVLSGYDASEGALFVLFMMVLAAHTRSPLAFAVDNFDQSLNPRAARALTRAFCEALLAARRQAFLTTHNPLVLDGLDLSDERIRLFTVSRNAKGHTKIRRVAVKNLAAAKAKHGEFAVSRLWVEGRLGGMPSV
ncbi:MAG: AAA family ATPase [Nannocystales bacterium]